MGVSPRRLWGEEAKTRLIPDEESGGFIVEREPEFTPEDVDLLLAAREADASISPRGIPFEDEFDPNATFHVGDDRRDPRVNYAEVALEKTKKDWEKRNPKGSTAGHVWPVVLTD